MASGSSLSPTRALGSPRCGLDTYRAPGTAKARETDRKVDKKSNYGKSEANNTKEKQQEEGKGTGYRMSGGLY